MKTHVTTRYLLSVTVSMMALCVHAGAGPDFFEDFSDGNMTDGLPVNWIFSADPSGGTEGFGAGDLDGNLYIYRDVSISAQIKRISDHTNSNWVSGFVCRWSNGPTGGYWIEVRPPNRFLFGHRDRYILRSATLPFNVDETELIIHVDAAGDELKAWCWPADEPMPEEPQISLIDDVAPEGTVAIYWSSRGGQSIYRWVKVVSLEVPIVDFNGDGNVDIRDLLRLIESWGQDDPMCDIAPHPYGDGVVDAQDLELLMSYWGQPVDDPTLIAHWALDETEGGTAHDSISGEHSFIMGDPVWQPIGGQVDGALQFDGVDDCVITTFALNPAEEALSAFAWIKGGVAGQAVISESGGANWLCLDPLTGNLMTELQSPRSSGPLLAETVVADGQWHRIGFVWDGSYRTLCVDGIAVAQDTQEGLKSACNSLYVGTDKAMAPGTYFSGLIDEVRIYNRAVSP